ncbi:betaine-aldehyde dehydrogenase [Sedimentitalea sp. CY04]|uniref:Betaine-aldehyde dehydrogenase n=1 Tax=Parasedimentitalea denitrificans TaxID=2211118 RepID=A0ABX0W7I0_9RHOB|nr:betaine-aldehyde dehydrogenase [Sedimentitalea sp. CY04]NIZ60121.1 betaine-aldehyde dehydrogenase [Sedimentitalea sp. CY04]
MTATVQPTASHFINGAYIEDSSGTEIPVIYAATGEQIATVHDATADIIEMALASAKAGQKIWAAMTGTERGRVLRRAADIMRDRNHELSVLETYDTGKPMSETLYVDATSGADALEYFGGLAGSLTGEHIPMGQDWVYTVREPLGLCVGIGAWNYPTQIACWKAAPALACGNSMVFKPSEVTPLCALKVAEIFIEAGLPAGVFNVIQGRGEVGGALVTDPRVDKVSLTGSAPTGKKVYAAAAAGMKHVTMELGGKSPLIIFDDADLENAVGGAILANFYSSGQVCSNGTRVFVQSGIKEAFLARLAERLDTAVIGDPMDGATTFGPMVSENQLDIALSYIAKGKDEGARVVYGGNALDREGWYIQPTVFADVNDGMVIAREEIFGPVMAVLDFDDEDDVIARANDTEFGLAAGVFTSDLSRAHRVIGAMEAGSCFINSYNDAPVEAPFGGVKASGVGRENSKEAIKHYSQVKSVYVRMGDVEAPF